MIWLALPLVFWGLKKVYDNWEQIRDWFANVLREVAKLIREAGKFFGPRTRHATEVVAILLDRAAAKIAHKTYVEQPDGNIKITTSEAEVPLDEVKPEIRRKLKVIGEEYNVEQEMMDEVRDY